MSGVIYSERVGVTPKAVFTLLAVLDGPVLFVAAASSGPWSLRLGLTVLFLLGTIVLIGLAQRRRHEIDSEYLHVGRKRLRLSDIVEVEVIPGADARQEAWGFRSLAPSRVISAIWTDNVLRVTARRNWVSEPPWRWRPIRWYLGSRDPYEFRARLLTVLSTPYVGRQPGHRSIVEE